MNQNAKEVAISTIEALKGYPFILSMLVFNIVFMGVVAYSINQTNVRHDTQIHKLIERCTVQR